jgi:dipeptidyl aminopeptidase/acylaminoacyl peptidase
LSAVAPNQNEFLTVQMMSNTYAITYLHTEGERISLTPDPGKVHVASEAVFANDSTIYLVTDYDQEFAYIAKYDIPSKEFTPVLQFDNESVSTIKWHEASKTLWVKTESGVQDYLYTYSIEDETLTKIDKPFDLIDQLTVAESGTVYALGKSSTLPLNIFRKRVGEKWEAITSNKVLGVAEDQMVNSEVITYRSFDGMDIEAQLFRANEAQANGYTIFWPHGGPQSAERKSFRALFQCLLNRGYNIFAPNFRGSTGYGSSFTKLVEGDWGEGPRLDCVAGMEWLFDNHISSKEKLFVVGGSYGGYMTLLLAGRHHDYFRAAVDIFGPCNLFTFINSVPEHWKPLMKRWLGDPIEDKERLEKDSPITYLEHMKKPMLVIQGANDPRVIKAESDQIVEALRSNGLSVEYLVLDDEGHGFSKKANEIKVYEMILEFLAKHH